MFSLKITLDLFSLHIYENIIINRLSDQVSFNKVFIQRDT